MKKLIPFILAFFLLVCFVSAVWINPTTNEKIYGTYVFNANTTLSDAVNATFYFWNSSFGWQRFSFVENSTPHQVFFNTTNNTENFLTNGNYTFNVTFTNVSGEIENFNVSAMVLNTHFSVSQNVKYINRTENTLINLTITSESGNNITLVNITLPRDFSFIAGSDSTNAQSVFSNTSHNLIWNTSLNGFEWGTTKSFLFNITAQTAGNRQLNVIAAKISGQPNQTLVNFTVNFAFSGYVKNETGGWQNGTNVTIYQFIMQQNGPPIERAVASTLSNTQGFFSFPSINGSSREYKLKLIYYENGIAKKVSTILPPFPAMIYYPTPVDPNMPTFMKPPTLNGTTFYLESAATINITAKGNYSYTPQKFGYEIMEQKTGFPVESNIMTRVNNAQIIVPINRNYTVMVLRDPSQFSFSQLCDGTFMNDTLCPAPPKSNSSINPTTQGQVINVEFNLTTQKFRVYGCINVEGNSTKITNITSIIPRLLPWPGFVPPVKDTGDLNLSDTGQLNHSDPECPNSIAFYNISLMNAAYLLEFYGKNSSSDENAEWLGAFQNITVNANTELNITLRPLAGSYVTGGDVNTSKVTINFVNSSQSLITTDTPHAEVYIRNSSLFGSLHYIIEDVTNGSFSMPILSNVIAKVRYFPNQAPPGEITLNLSRETNNITLITTTAGDSGFRKINASGVPEQINVSEMPINMKFLRNSGSCNVLEPSSSCAIANTNASDFNPLTALVAGKINMEMSIINTGVTIRFMNYDMFSAKQPPMHSILNENASSRLSSSSSLSEIWEFGSFAPSDVYDYVIIKIPYSDSPSASNYMNDSWSYNVKIPLFYDENWNVIWNSTRGDTARNLTYEYLDYNSSSLYRNFLTSSGVSCSKTDSSFSSYPCYINTSSNVLYLKIPHFSGISPSISGSAPSGGTTSPGGGGAGGGAGKNVTEKKGQTWAKLEGGETATMNVKNKKIGVEKITFVVKKGLTLNDVELNVEQISDISGLNITKLENAYKYFKIITKNIKSDQVSKVEIEFSVSKEWLKDYDENSVKLQRWLGKEYQELNAEKLSSDDNYVYYKATSPGFSIFAITAEPKAIEKEKEKKPLEEIKKKIEEKAKRISWWVWLILGIIVLIIILLIIFRPKHKIRK